MPEPLDDFDPHAAHLQIPIDAEGGLLHAICLVGKARLIDTPAATNFDTLSTLPTPIWIHLDRTKPDAQRWLRERSGVDPIVCDALLEENTRPRASERNGGFLAIFRGINLNPGAEPDELISIRIWVDAKRIITLRQTHFHVVSELRSRVRNGTLDTTPMGILVAIASGLSSDLGPVVENLQLLIDDSEDALAEEATHMVSVRELAVVRRQAITLRRYLAPQRDMLVHMLSSPAIDPRHRAELLECADRTSRFVEDLEEVRDRAAVSQEELRAQRELRSARVMYMLTLVAAVFLPLTFVTGLLGINVGGIPGDSDPLAFWIVTILLIGVGVCIVVLFKRLRWL